MSLIQRIVTALVPRSLAASMEAESREWMMRCPCGYEQSLWDAGQPDSLRELLRRSR